MDSEVVGKSGGSPCSFLVVGVGVSVDDVHSSQELVRHLGADPGIAVVIIHSGAPDSVDQLAKHLPRVSSMPVHPVADQMVEPNHVYVMSPRGGIELVGGRFQQPPRRDAGDLHLPIDSFFTSLARDQSSSAVGVVLGGIGSDGALGVCSIQAAGGITLAQDSTAEHRSMPSSAIATGSVDFVLAPDKIAERLRALAKHSGPRVRAEDEAEVERIISVVRDTNSIDFGSYVSSVVRRGIERRMRIHGVESISEYAHLVEEDPDEATVLSEDGRLHVARFFGDPLAFDALRTEVFPKLLESHQDGSPIRVWVSGCSTGEEVYSIAISLVEFLRGRGSCKIFGTDPSAGAIAAARHGRYPIGIQGDVSPERLTAFFVRGDYHQIGGQIRHLCVFAQHDVTADPPIPAVDLFVASNLSDFRDEVVDDQLAPMFSHALKPGGFLLIGSRARRQTLPGFTVADTLHTIHARGPRLHRNGSSPSRERLARRRANATATAAEATAIRREADRVVVAAFGPPGVLVADDLSIVQIRGRTSPYLELPQGTPALDLSGCSAPTSVPRFDEPSKRRAPGGRRAAPPSTTGCRRPWRSR